MSVNELFNQRKQEGTRRCDWCGKMAVTRTYRTLYEDTEFENTSSFYECAECAAKPTSEILGQN